MAEQPPRNPVALPPEADDSFNPPSARAKLDANGFDPAEFEWRPVPRRPRADGWLPEVQIRFIQALAETGTVEQACREVGMSVASAYRLRHSPGGERFARAWRAALMACAERVLDVCFERVILGVDEPVFDRDGVRIGAKHRYDHRLAAFLLRAYFPERFRHAARDSRAPDETAPPAEPPVPDAVAALGPVTPAEPHQLTPPDRMAELIEGARACAEVDALYPPDEREPYTPPRVEAAHPRCHARQAARRRREQEREDREAAKRGWSEPDDGDSASP